MPRYKKGIMISVGIVILITIAILGRTPFLEEIGEKIKSTATIRVEKKEKGSNEFIFYQVIRDRNKVQEITDFVSSLGTEEWVAVSEKGTTVSDMNSEDYRLKFLDEKNKTIAILETSSSQPMKLKYKIHTYELGIKSNEVLRNIIEQNKI